MKTPAAEAQKELEAFSRLLPDWPVSPMDGSHESYLEIMMTATCHLLKAVHYDLLGVMKQLDKLSDR